MTDERANDGSTTIRHRPEEHPSLRATTLLVYHRDGVATVSLVEGVPVVIGREPPADLVLEDRSVSRRHVRVALEEGAVSIEDLGSTNGTQLNGQTIERARMRPGDELRFGAVVASLHLTTPAELRGIGLHAHDDLIGELEAEAERARFFHRAFALLLVKSESQENLTRWFPRMKRALRSIDRAALYAPGVVEVLLPQIEPSEAEAIARAIASMEGEQLFVGAALFPKAASSAEALLDSALVALRRADGDRTAVVLGVEPTAAIPSTPIFSGVAMTSVLETVDRIADALVPVLIQGETGTGKEVIARMIHERSGRRSQPICTVNCAAIPGQLVESTLFGHEKGAFTGATERAKGVFEAADRGTVFLDEIGELPPSAQAALLRVLESKRLTRVGATQEIEIDVRVAAATHRDLEKMCEEGSFRSDLLYRLNTVILQLPPLRDRPEELHALIDHFLARANRENRKSVSGVAPEAREAFERHSWPGNLRELKNAIDRAVVIARDDLIRLEDLPEKLRKPPPRAEFAKTQRTDLFDLDLPLTLKERQQKLECGLILAALERTSGNQTDAAKALGMPLRTLVARIKAYGIRKLGYGFEAERESTDDPS